MADFRARIEAFLDLARAQSEINSFVNQNRTIRLGIEVNNSGRQILSQLSNIQSQAGNIGRSTGENFARGFESAVGTINTRNAENTIARMQRSLAGFKFDRSQIAAATQQIESMDLQIQNITTNIRRNGNIEMRVTGIQDLGNGIERVVTQTKVFDRESHQLISTGKTISQTFQGIASATRVATQGNNFEAWVTKSGSALNNFGSQVEELRTRMENMQNSGATKAGLNAWVEDWKYLQSQVKQVQADMAQAANAVDLSTAGNKFAKWANDNQKNLTGFEKTLGDLQRRMEDMQKNGATKAQFKDWSRDVANFKSEVDKAKSSMTQMADATKMAIAGNNMTAWVRNNSKAMRQYGNEIRELQRRMQDMLKNGATQEEFQKWSQDWALLQSQMKATGAVGKTFGENFKSALTSVTQFAASYFSLYRVFSMIREGIQTIIEMDDALVDLQKTSDATPKQLESFYRDANDVAKEYGTTTTQIIQGAADWSRLGYALEEAEQMSKLSAQFAAISPGMSVEESTKGLVSTMKAFGIETADVLDGVMSKINKVGNSFALSNNDVIVALENSSSAMAAANNSLDETIALITAGTEIVQDSSKVGNGLRTKFCAYVQKCA